MFFIFFHLGQATLVLLVMEKPRRATIQRLGEITVKADKVITWIVERVGEGGYGWRDACPKC